jgi:3-hydroxyisobutyrate dehydrogenase-like beta-hydroxyacid dehydrogenase
MTNNVSVIGAGAMGAALVRVLVKSGYAVTVWNRSAAKAEPLRGEGASVAIGVREAVQASSIILVCVKDYEVTRELLRTLDVSPRLKDKIVVQLSTGTPQEARDDEAWTQAEGAKYLDGAILAVPSQMGRPETPLFISGPEALYQEVEPVLRTLAGSTTYVGSAIGAASAWDFATLSSLFGMLFGFLHGARIFEAEGLSVKDLGAAIGTILPLVSEVVHDTGNRIEEARYGDAESSLEICYAGFRMFERHAKEAAISAEFPAFAAALSERGMTAGYADEAFASLIKVLRKTSREAA